MNSRKSRKVLNSISLSLFRRLFELGPFTISGRLRADMATGCQKCFSSYRQLFWRVRKSSGIGDTPRPISLLYVVVFRSPLSFQPSVFPAPTTLGARIAQRTAVDKLATASRHRQRLLLLFFPLSLSAHRTSSGRGFSRIWTQG